MLDILKFVQGAIARKDFVPALTHFRLSQGRILGYNGSMALCSPINLSLECCPKAKPFVKAIEGCSEAIELELTSKMRLSVKSGAFHALVECCADEYPGVHPEGERIDLPPGLLASLRKLAPFIAEDASRPWAQGVLFQGESAFVTNNIVLVEAWLGARFPTVNIPRDAVTEIIRIGQDPTHLQIGENSITFHFENERWLRAQLLTTEWPDAAGMLDAAMSELRFARVPENFYTGVRSLVPFLNELEQVFFLPGKLATGAEEEPAAKYELLGGPEAGIFNAHQIDLLEKLIEQIDFSKYPAPCPFLGENLRGVIVGMHG